MTKHSPGDVVLVEIVFSEGIGTKKRPALIISRDFYHEGRQEVIVAAITSNVKRVLPGDTKIAQWKAAGLIFPSLVSGIIQTIKRSMIARKLGVLTKEDFLQVQKNLSMALAL